jgi:hypothetical protein
MLKREKLFWRKILSSLFFFCLSVFILSIAVPAQADDGASSETFYNNGDLSMQHVDQSPWKGWYTLTATNKTDTTWWDFHFSIWDYLGNGTTVVFCDSSSTGCSVTGNDPTATRDTNNILKDWTIADNKRSIDLFFSTGVDYDETIVLNVWTDNDVGVTPRENFGMMFHPSVPEPVSTTLFILGGATLGFRRYWKKRKSI